MKVRIVFIILIFYLIHNTVSKKCNCKCYNHQYCHESCPHVHHDVPIQKLCSWKTLTWNNPVISDGSGACDWDDVPNYIIPRNRPTAFEIAPDGRVFIGVRRDASSIYSTLNYFYLQDIQNGTCPPLNPYPSLALNQLLAKQCEHPDRMISVDRFTIDSCANDPKLWVTDLNGLQRFDRSPYTFGEGTLKIFSLQNNTLLRSIPIPISIDDYKGLGLTTVVVNVDPNNCEDAYAYILDKIHAQIIVYSWAENTFWTVATPSFHYDSMSTDFCLETCNGTKIPYFVTDGIFDAVVDHKNKQLIFHARASLHEYSIDLDTLHNKNINARGPENIPIHYLGEKNEKGQTGTSSINPDTQTVWAIQEQNNAIVCWNTERPLSPYNVEIVTSCPKTLPFLVDLQRTEIPGQNKSGIFVLSNNEKQIQLDGFNFETENFGIYYIDESEAFNKYPQCLPPKSCGDHKK